MRPAWCSPAERCGVMDLSPAAGLFDEGVIVAEVMPLPDDAPLLPAEAAVVAAVAPRRRREFAAGRWCARQALVRLGIEGFALLPSPDRAPRWPPGIVGSISHTSDYCVAVVARQRDFLGVGVDAEPDEPIDP